MSAPPVGPRWVRCTVCGMEFRAASRGVVASRCAACQAAWRKAFDRLRPSRNKAERAEYYAQKKAAGLIENGKVKRGRPAKSNRDRMNSVTRSQVDAIREQLDRMAASDLFYARAE